MDSFETTELTLIAPDVPLIEVAAMSTTVIVWLPLVFSVAEKLAAPFVRVELAGNTACPSVLLKRRVPV
jgi:hypothetical protein